jgi:thiamine-monophosphate kinase
MIGKKTHIPPRMSYFQMGRKAVVVNMSDLAAKGAEPIGMVFSVGLPADIPIENIEEIAKGMGSAAKEYKTCIIGGDTNQTNRGGYENTASTTRRTKRKVPWV